MPGDSNDWLNTLHSAPIGPATTLARSFSMAVAMFAGLVCLAAPSLQGVPWPNRIIAGLGGVALIAISIAGSVRWKPLITGMKRDAENVGGTSVFAFMQAAFADPRQNDPEFFGSGWVVRRGDVLVLSQRATPVSLRRTPVSSIPLREIVGVSFRTADSTYFHRLIIELKSGKEATFTLVPPNGSALRGATEKETRNAMERVLSGMRSVDPDS